jgi:hypothetical protein
MAMLGLTACVGVPGPINSGESDSKLFVQSFPNPFPGDADSKGAFSVLFDWPTIALHAALLPNGKVFSFGTGLSQLCQSGGVSFPCSNNQFVQARSTVIWNPRKGLDSASFETLNVPSQPGDQPTDLFCAAQTLTSDGRLLMVAGQDGADAAGETDLNIFDYRLPLASSWTPYNAANQGLDFGRWYPTTTTLPSGDVLITAGTYTAAAFPATKPELWLRTSDPSGWLQTLTAADQPFSGGGAPAADRNPYRPWPYYTWNFVDPDDGRVFMAGPNPGMFYLDPSGAGSISYVGQREPSNLYSSNVCDGADSADCVAAWGNSRDYGTAVMYDSGKILIAGGGRPRFFPDQGYQDGWNTPTNTALVVDINGSGTTVTPTASMLSARRQHNATILPNGEVWVVGGSSGGTDGAQSGSGENNLYGLNNENAKVLSSELWNPQSGQWRLGASLASAAPRMYHSVSLLLPNGAVLVAGGGRCSGCQTYNLFNAQVYFPPYFFASNGTQVVAADRPAITAAPSAIGYGQRFKIATSTLDLAQVKVSLIRLGSVTHSFDMDQRLLWLTLEEAAGGLWLTAPANSKLAPPGYYLLFVVEAGRPSVGKIVQLR